MSTAADLAKRAHALLAQGLHPFPTDHPDQPDASACTTPSSRRATARAASTPTVAWGTWATTVTPQQIDRAWAKHGGLANVAIACGPSDLVVLDEDQAAELDKWCVTYGVTLPATREVTTGRGRHLYFNWDHSKQPIGNGSKAFDNFKIDVRGKGGIVIAEGSRHASGADYFDNGKPIADLPQNVADLIIAGQSQPTQPQSAARRGHRQPEHQR